MSWTEIVLLGLATYVLRAFGFFVRSEDDPSPRLAAALALMPAALIGGLVLLQTTSAGLDGLVPRLGGVVAGLVAAAMGVRMVGVMAIGMAVALVLALAL